MFFDNSFVCRGLAHRWGCGSFAAWWLFMIIGFV